ncbi:hypothetical protein Heshes_18740 [Alicyclobacillus hesperidum]|uniref:Copper amine oxidase N-terminal domain-containing protein n=1 Tax=Alicyclobacillus hesperidum TaxID=89784 RepID=A0AA37U4K3_9BACL|nr:hypothetical protein [Alicyclobacillus hesperidum]GLV14190.1 hypothetical protein Heshes_18740 [Alicyclobacillus hesperidum]
MKRTLSSISAAAIVLGTGIPMVFADTTSTTPSYTQVDTVAFQFNGQTVANPYILDSQDSGNTTAFAPVYYFNQLLAKAGIQATWNGSTHTWALTAPNIDASKVQVAGGVGTGNTTITLNGTTIKMINTFAAQDPAGKKGDITTYFPAYYVNNLFAALGISATWNGSTGLAVNTQATALTAKQTAAAQVAVNFNGPVASGTTVTLSQNGVNYTTTATWSGNTEVTLNTGYNLPAGTYTVTAGSLSGTVTIAEAVPTSIEITTKGLATVSGATVNYTVLDQFGNAVTNVSGITVSAFDSTNGTLITGSVAGSSNSVSLNLSSGVAKGDNVVVTVSDPSYALTATTTIPVVGVTNIASIKLGAATENGSTNLTSGTVSLAYTATDAAGDSVLLSGTNSGGIIDGVQFLSSNPNVVSASSISVDPSGNLTFAALATGTATITAVDLATGQTSSVTVNIENANGVNSFNLAAPSTMVIAGQATTVPYSATDAFGQAISQSNFGPSYQSNITWQTSNSGVLPVSGVTWNESNNSLQVTPTSGGTVTLYALENGTIESSITLNVNPAAYAYAITGTDIPTEFENGATYTIQSSDFTVKNQYGGTYSVPSGDSWTITSSNSSVVSVSGDTITGGSTSGTATLTFTLTDGAAPNSHTVSYSVNVSEVPSSDVATYALSVPSTIYASSNSAYYGAVSVTGKDSSGNTVAVNNSATVAQLLTSNSGVVSIVSKSQIDGVASGTATITALSSTGSVLGTATVTVSDNAPAPAVASFSQASYSEATPSTATDITNTLSSDLTVKDQYGVTVTSPTGYWFSSNSSVVLVSGSTVLAEPTKGSATVTFVTSNGVTATIQVVNN